MGQRGSFKGNLKTYWTKWKWNHSISKAVLRRKFTALTTYIREERSQTINVSCHLKTLEKEERAKPRASKRKQ